MYKVHVKAEPLVQEQLLLAISGAQLGVESWVKSLAEFGED